MVLKLTHSSESFKVSVWMLIGLSDKTHGDMTRSVIAPL
jgi:hypothetical protein